MSSPAVSSSSSSTASVGSKSVGPVTCDCWVAQKPRERIVKGSVTLLPLEPDQVEVTVLASGVCASDLDAFDKTSFAFQYPLVAGHEGVGIIRAVGDRVPASVTVGQRVGLGCYRHRCFSCEMCFAGQNNLCKKKELMFAKREGCFSTVVRIHHEFAIPIPEALSTVHAAPLLCAGVTVYSPLKQHNVRGGDRVGVVGIGGLGHLAIQFAAKLGCEVTAISQTKAKEPLAKQLGAKHFLELSNADAVKTVAGTLNFILVTAAGDDGVNWATLFNLLAPNGKIILVGIILKEISIPGPALLMGQKAIVGSAAGSTATAVEMLRFAAVNGVQAQVETFPFTEINEVFEKVKKNQVRFRAVLCHDQTLITKGKDQEEKEAKRK